MHSPATTPKEYLDSLPPERRKVVSIVRDSLKKNLPKGFKEIMQYGMISYVVPLSKYPAGYLGKKDVPLPYAALAMQKNHYAVYLMALYSDPKLIAWFTKEYEKSGKKMDVGKSCVRFKKLEDLPLELVGEAVGKVSVDEWIALYENAWRR